MNEKTQPITEKNSNPPGAEIYKAGLTKEEYTKAVEIADSALLIVDRIITKSFSKFEVSEWPREL
jgi:hypothetical protein